MPTPFTQLVCGISGEVNLTEEDHDNMEWNDVAVTVGEQHCCHLCALLFCFSPQRTFAQHGIYVCDTLHSLISLDAVSERFVLLTSTPYT